MARSPIHASRRDIIERRRRYALAHSSAPIPLSDSSSAASNNSPPPGAPAPRLPPPPPEMLTRLQARQRRRSGFRVTFYQSHEEEPPLLIPPPSYDSDGDYVPSEEESEDTSATSPPAHPPVTINAPTSQTDSSERSFCQKMRDGLLEQATGLEVQADDLYDRAETLREMAADCEGGGPEYSEESW